MILLISPRINWVDQEWVGLGMNLGFLQLTLSYLIVLKEVSIEVSN
jgi:hypothetical protein